MKRKRSSTVEPRLDTLINFTAMKRINTRGFAAANKCLILAATCYNLKKWMKHVVRNSNENLQALSKEAAGEFKPGVDTLLHLKRACFSPSNIIAGF